MDKNGFALFLALTAIAVGAFSFIKKPVIKAANATGEIEAPTVVTHLDVSKAKTYQNNGNADYFNVSSLTDYSEENNTDYFSVTQDGNNWIISEKEENQYLHFIIMPVRFSVHLGARQEAVFSLINIQLTAYKTVVNKGTAGSIAELLAQYPVGTFNTSYSVSEDTLAKVDSGSAEHHSVSYDYGSFKFINNSDVEADVYIPETYYFAMTMRYASTRLHVGVTEICVSSSTCTYLDDAIDEDVCDRLVDQELHFKHYAISESDNSDTTACKGTNGYYSIAKSYYDNMTHNQKELFCTADKYINARARLDAWALQPPDLENGQ